MGGNYWQGYNRTFVEVRMVRWTSSHYGGVRLVLTVRARLHICFQLAPFV